MMQMNFLPILQDFLNTRGEVYTLRSYKQEKKVAICVPRVGLCEREYIKPISRKNELSTFVNKSGFTNSDAWWRKAVSLSGDRQLHLYRVTRG